jgi:hypothetical protein
VVIHDFLRRLVGQRVVGDILEFKQYAVPGGRSEHVVRRRLLFYKWREQPYMPVEFSVAAYRFGHSMARPSYFINDVARTDPPVAGVSRIRLFSHDPGELSNLNGFRPLPREWGFQWKYFLANIKDQPGERDQFLPQPSYKLDAELSNPLSTLPDSVARPEVLVPGVDPAAAQVLSVRNLLRGLRLGLPSGQDVARAMGIRSVLTDDQLYGGLDLPANALTDLAGHAPLWYYVLKEAEIHGSGERLGPVGGRIVAEVLIGLLDGDPLSYLSVDPTWVPTLKSAKEGDFTLSDLINFGRPDPEPGPSPDYGQSS